MKAVPTVHTEQTSKSREEDLETFDAIVFHQRALAKHDLPQQRSADSEDNRVEFERKLISQNFFIVSSQIPDDFRGRTWQLAKIAGPQINSANLKSANFQNYKIC